MDEQALRNEAERHANATVAGDLKTAGSSLTQGAVAQAGGGVETTPGRVAGERERGG